MKHRGLRLLSACMLLSTCFFAATAGVAHAKDAFVVLSGGMTPEANHYSQYLQARAYVTFLRARYAEDAIWVFFGAGNRPDQPPILADVEKDERDKNGRATTTWVAGMLPGNRAARKDVLARAFREEILPAVKDGGTVYLFVGDHGGPSGAADTESVISLWSWDRDPSLRFGWRRYAGEDLGVAELRRWLAQGLGKGRVVFVMSQCYSGGFHYLGVPRAVAPPASWFKRVPAWAAAIREPANLPAAAGFTATDDHSVASGCTSDVSADNWAGYERYLPESLTGLNPFDLKPGATAEAPSFYAAHAAAAAMDHTLDKPRSTSEQYLHEWARTIQRIEKTPDVLAESTRSALRNFDETMNGKEIAGADAALSARQAEYRGVLDRMIKDNPALGDLRTASRQNLEKSINSPKDAEDAMQGQEWNALREYSGQRTHWEDMQLGNRLWAREIAPAWKRAIESDTPVGLDPTIADFERDLVALDSDRDEERAAGGDRNHAQARALAYFHAGYADPGSLDPARARHIMHWELRRNAFILAWAKKSADEKLRAAASVYASLQPGESDDAEVGDESPAASQAQGIVASLGRWLGMAGASQGTGSRRTLARNVAAERIYLQREVLAAWQLLLATNQREAVRRIDALTQLERLPLPPRAANAEAMSLPAK